MSCPFVRFVRPICRLLCFPAIHTPAAHHPTQNTHHTTAPCRPLLPGFSARLTSAVHKSEAFAFPSFTLSTARPAAAQKQALRWLGGRMGSGSGAPLRVTRPWLRGCELADPDPHPPLPPSFVSLTQSHNTKMGCVHLHVGPREQAMFPPPADRRPTPRLAARLRLFCLGSGPGRWTGSIQYLVSAADMYI